MVYIRLLFRYHNIRLHIEQTTSGFASVAVESKRVNVRRGSVKYALLPVWMLSTKWRDQNYLFAMNGQTGKLVGNLPISWTRFFAWFSGIFAASAAVMSLIRFVFL